MRLIDILVLKYPQEVQDHLIRVQDDGQGPFISRWPENLGEIPNQGILDVWAQELDLQYRQKRAIEARKYPSIGDQLDMLYKDMKANTSNWVQTIDAIKAAHPKPTE